MPSRVNEIVPFRTFISFLNLYIYNLYSLTFLSSFSFIKICLLLQSLHKYLISQLKMTVLFSNNFLQSKKFSLYLNIAERQLFDVLANLSLLNLNMFDKILEIFESVKRAC